MAAPRGFAIDFERGVAVGYTGYSTNTEKTMRMPQMMPEGPDTDP